MREFFIAGVQHHDIGRVLDSLEEGTGLDLVPEPTNKYDPNAVKIQLDGVMLGYVPKKFSAEIAGLIEMGADCLCTISYLNKTAKPWEMCKVRIDTEGDEDETTG